MNRITPILVSLLFVLFSCGEADHHHHGDEHEHGASHSHDGDHHSHDAEDESLNALMEKAMATPGLIHNVYFWLKDDITDEAKATFMTGAESLGTIESIQTFYMGPHADTEARGVVDHSYDLSLVIMFEDMAAHDAYQVDSIHLAFIEASKDAWAEVKVYDVAIE